MLRSAIKEMGVYYFQGSAELGIEPRSPGLFICHFLPKLGRDPRSPVSQSLLYPLGHTILSAFQQVGMWEESHPPMITWVPSIALGS